VPNRLPLVALALGLCASWSTPALASCARRTAKQYVDGAELVFLGRAGPIKVRGKKSHQPIAVLHVIKGKPGKVFTRVRDAGERMPNDRLYKDGEVALFFVNKGSIDLCSGNFPLEGQMDDMATFLALGRDRGARPDVAAVQRVVRELLVPYLHDRPAVPVTYPPLAGKRFQQGKTTLTFVTARRKDAIELRKAARHGQVILIEGVYHLEGFVFRALLLADRAGKLEVLHQAGWERRSR